MFRLLCCLVLAITFTTEAYAETLVSASENEKILHLLNRINYGPKPGDIERVKAIGIDNFIAQQLAPAAIPMPNDLNEELSALSTTRMTPIDLFRQYGPPSVKDLIQIPTTGEKPDKKASQQALHKNYRYILEEAVQSRLSRAIDSPRQLQEVMTDFWFNHFNVSIDKGLDHLWVGAYEQQAIAPNTLGKFRYLLGATCHHPAMLFYLDNWQNSAANSQSRNGKFKGLNENYARELMELHTLGVDGGYSQQDVIALARILTGLGVSRGGKRLTAASSFGYTFDRQRHDFGTKVFLGQTIQGSGEKEIEQALDILARHPATARHISYKLAQYFVCDNPPKALVDRLAYKFRMTDGDISAVLNELFHSSEFWDPQYYQAKFKTPYQYVVSSIRAGNVELTNYRPVYGFLKQLGMPLYGCQTPDGYKNTEEAWLNPDGMLRRVNFATSLASGRFPNNRLGAMDYKQLMNTLGNNFSAKTMSVVEKSADPLKACLILGSPEFLKH